MTAKRDNSNDPMAPLDEYERYIDDIQNGLALCSGVDCRDPISGPWVIIVDNMTEDAIDANRMMCLSCFCSEVLNVDPSDAGL